jgi:hypothetical protein
MGEILLCPKADIGEEARTLDAQRTGETTRDRIAKLTYISRTVGNLHFRR